MKTIEDLKADPRTKEVEIILKKAGITDAWWEGLLNRVAALPARHALITKETMVKARERRGKLAEKMRILAGKIADDPEAFEFYPKYGGAKGQQPTLRIGQPHEGALSIAGWLTAYAQHFEAGSGHDAIMGPLEKRLGARFEPFVIRGVFDSIDSYLAAGLSFGIRTKLSRMNKVTALLAGALLGKKVKPNRVSALRQKERRRNSKE